MKTRTLAPLRVAAILSIGIRGIVTRHCDVEGGAEIINVESRRNSIDDRVKIEIRDAVAVAAVLLVTFLNPLQTSAQSFTYANPGGASPTISFTFNSEELPRDFNGSTGSPPSSSFLVRIAGSINQRYRVMAGPFFRGFDIHFRDLAMDSMSPPQGGGAGDRVELDWFYSATPTALDGTHTTGVNIVPPAANGTDSMMFPGMIFRVRTGPDSTRGLPTLEHESWGFHITSAHIVSNGTMGSSVLPTLAYYDSAVVMLAPNDDTVDSLIQTPSGTGSTTPRLRITAFPSDGLAGGGLAVWARCGALPTATAWDVRRYLPVTTQGGVYLELPSCASTWFLTTTNASIYGRATRINVNVGYPSYVFDNINVGISTAVDSATLTSIQRAFQQAAWRIYGLSGGALLLRSFRYFNNADHCDDGWPADQFACNGSPCRYCVTNNCSNSFTQAADGVVSMCPQAQWTAGNIIAHESAHSYIHFAGNCMLQDEYHRNGSGLPAYNQCNHSFMCAYDSDTFCVDGTHSASTEDGTSSPMTSIRGPLAYWPPGASGGVMGAGACPVYPVWTILSMYGWAPFAYPNTQQSPDSYPFSNFYWTASSPGDLSLGQVSP